MHNPYEAPGTSFVEVSEAQTHIDDLSRLFWRWEKLRIVYNAVLVLIVLILLGTSITRLETFSFLLVAAIGANVLYCSGFTINVYVQRLGVRSPKITYGLFSLGMMIAISVTFGMLAIAPFKKF